MGENHLSNIGHVTSQIVMCYLLVVPSNVSVKWNRASCSCITSQECSIALGSGDSEGQTLNLWACGCGTQVISEWYLCPGTPFYSTAEDHKDGVAYDLFIVGDTTLLSSFNVLIDHTVVDSHETHTVI